METQNDWENNKKRFTTFHCQLCGKQYFSESIRCPECGRIACRNCSTEFHDEEKILDQMLCKICNYNKLSNIEEKQKRDAIRWSKILFVILVIFFIMTMVIRWF